MVVSADNALGTIKIFERFQIQTSKGNVPNLHIFWTAEKKSDAPIRTKSAGSYRQLLHELGIEKDDIINPKCYMIQLP